MPSSAMGASSCTVKYLIECNSPLNSIHLLTVAMKTACNAEHTTESN